MCDLICEVNFTVLRYMGKISVNDKTVIENLKR